MKGVYFMKSFKCYLEQNNLFDEFYKPEDFDYDFSDFSIPSNRMNSKNVKAKLLLVKCCDSYKVELENFNSKNLHSAFSSRFIENLQKTISTMYDCIIEINIDHSQYFVFVTQRRNKLKNPTVQNVVDQNNMYYYNCKKIYNTIARTDEITE